MTIFSLPWMVLVLVLVFSGSSSSQTVSYDELLLVLQWPTSYCNTEPDKCDSAIPDKFTVHGLWLNKNSKGINCPQPNPRINLSRQLSSGLRKDLEKYWPNLNSRNRDSRGRREFLWEHEYERHGYCFPEFRNPVDYFRTTLAIATVIGDVKMTMTLRSGKSLTYGQLYRVKSFEPVTIAGRKLTPWLRCNYATGSVTPQLHEIVFCTDANKLLKHCPYKATDCNKQWWEGGIDMSGWFKFPSVPERPRYCPALPFGEM